MPELAGEGLPDVARVEGLQVELGDNRRPKSVLLQYTDHKGHWYQVKIPLASAIYLMALLQAMKSEHKIPVPDNPFEILSGGPPPTS